MSHVVCILEDENRILSCISMACKNRMSYPGLLGSPRGSVFDLYHLPSREKVVCSLDFIGSVWQGTGLTGLSDFVIGFLGVR